jgi:hypothetical protein
MCAKRDRDASGRYKATRQSHNGHTQSRRPRLPTVTTGAIKTPQEPRTTTIKVHKAPEGHVNVKGPSGTVVPVASTICIPDAVTDW